jgi:magnesium-transporting ATPase (P-type)
MSNPGSSRNSGATSADERGHAGSVSQDERSSSTEARRRDEYGGFNLGAAFFGWLVAMGVTILLTAIVSAVLAAIGSEYSITQKQAASSADTVGIVTAVGLLAILAIGYYAGGYVAGRMSRYDGGRQGAGVWVLGLLVSIAVAVLGTVAGQKYDLLREVNLPSLPITADEATAGAIVTLVAVLVGTLLAAVLGGKAGQHYHSKIDQIR